MFPRSCTSTTGPRMHAWGDHFSPIFYAMAPFVWLLPSVSVVLVLQTVALALDPTLEVRPGRR